MLKKIRMLNWKRINFFQAGWVKLWLETRGRREVQNNPHSEEERKKKNGR